MNSARVALVISHGTEWPDQMIDRGVRLGCSFAQAETQGIRWHQVSFSRAGGGRYLNARNIARFHFYAVTWGGASLAGANAHRRRGLRNARARRIITHKKHTGGRRHGWIFTPQFSWPDRVDRRRNCVGALHKIGQRGDGSERQVRPRDQGRRRARSQPVAARQARHRHSLGHDRGDRGRKFRPRARRGPSTHRASW